METIELYIYLLMAATLILGFLLISMLRGGAYHRKYEQETYEYIKEDEETTKKLDLSNQDLQNTKDQFTLIKNKLSSQNTLLGEFEGKKREFEIEKKNFETSKISLQNSIKSTDTKIMSASSELEVLNLEKDEILNYQNNILEQKSKTKNKSIGIKNLDDKISNLTREKDSLAQKIESQKENNDKKEQELSRESGKIKAIENEFETKIDDISKPLNESKQKALNYQYALEHVREKIDADENIEFEVVDKIISKNEEKGIFANLMQKLFNKSANYIKEGK